MKKIIVLAVLGLVFSASANAQLAKTKWTGSMKIPQSDNTLNSVPVVWTFSKDTVSVEVGNGEPEVFTYKDVKKVLMLSKVSGASPCPEAAKITMTYTVSKDELLFTNTTSDCDIYKKTSGDGPLKKMK